MSENHYNQTKGYIGLILESTLETLTNVWAKRFDFRQAKGIYRKVAVMGKDAVGTYKDTFEF